MSLHACFYVFGHTHAHTNTLAYAETPFSFGETKFQFTSMLLKLGKNFWGSIFFINYENAFARRLQDATKWAAAYVARLWAQATQEDLGKPVRDYFHQPIAFKTSDSMTAMMTTLLHYML